MRVCQTEGLTLRGTDSRRPTARGLRGPTKPISPGPTRKRRSFQQRCVGWAAASMALTLATAITLFDPNHAQGAAAPPARQESIVTGCHRVAPTPQITGAVRAAYQRGRGIPAGDARFSILVRCDRHRWFALAGVAPPIQLTQRWERDPPLEGEGLGPWMYQDGPDRFVGSGSAAWRHLGDTGGVIVCGRERGMFPRQVVRIAGRRCDRSPPQLIPLIPHTWEGCPERPRRILEVAASGLLCEAATDFARAIISHGGTRPEGAVRAGHRTWRCTTTGPVRPTGGPDSDKPSWYVARCDSGRYHLGIGTSA